jgi:alkaline phosphatase
MVVFTSFLGCSAPVEKNKDETSKPPNIIFLIGDGMGLAQISMTMEHSKDNLSFSKCKNIGFIKTSSIIDYITDSAAGATAFSTGTKTKNKYVAVDSSGNVLQTIFEQAKEKEWFTGLFATATLTHATPAAYFAHNKSRYAYNAIATDFYAGAVDIAVGSGSTYFSKDSLIQSGYAFLRGIEELEEHSGQKYISFLVDSASMPSISNGRPESWSARSTSKMIETASQQNNPFMLMIEGSQIDWGGHDNNAKYVNEELLDFDRCIEIALRYLKSNPNTLVLVTADHETGGLSLLDDENDQLKPHFSTNKHSGIMVPVFAFGKGADMFTGIYENTEVYHKLFKLMQLDIE